MRRPDASVRALELGRDQIPDLLAISISSTDYTGHAYGPDSWEYADHLRRVDRALLSFLEQLERDTPVAVLVTSDHGECRFVRLVGKYAWEHGLARENPLRVETDAGVKTLELETDGASVSRVTVDMGAPILEAARIPVRMEGPRIVDVPLEVGGATWRITCVSMGNPHCVIFVDDVEKFQLEKYGPLIENNELFPRRTNVEFVQVLSRTEVRQRTWERGAGETLACGTGAIASALGWHHLQQRPGGDFRYIVKVKGGTLTVHFSFLEEKKEYHNIKLEGPAAFVFEGQSYL